MYEKNLNLISEMGNGWTLKVQYFPWNLIKVYENNLNVKTEMGSLISLDVKNGLDMLCKMVLTDIK